MPRTPLDQLPLTPHQLRVLSLLYQNLKSTEIAAKLHCSLVSVHHVCTYSIYPKLKVRNRIHLMAKRIQELEATGGNSGVRRGTRSDSND